MGNFKEDIAQVEAIVLDVDGVMTDGGIIPTPDGDFIRRYDAKDGYAVAYAIREGYKVCVISGGRGEMLRRRLEMLGVTRFYLNCMDKTAAIEEFISDYGLNAENMIYMGDGETDVPCMKIVKMFGGNSIAVYNPDIKKKVNVAKKLLRQHRVNFITPARYTKESRTYEVVCAIIDKIKADFDLAKLAKSK